MEKKQFNRQIAMTALLLALLLAFLGLLVWKLTADWRAQRHLDKLPMELQPTAIHSQTDLEAAAEAGVTGSKATASAILIGVAALSGALAMGFAISKSAESIARQPEAAGSIRTAMMLGLVFIETVVIYALIVAILIIFVL